MGLYMAMWVWYMATLTKKKNRNYHASHSVLMRQKINGGLTSYFHFIIISQNNNTAYQHHHHLSTLSPSLFSTAIIIIIRKAKKKKFLWVVKTIASLMKSIINSSNYSSQIDRIDLSYTVYTPEVGHRMNKPKQN